MRGLWLNGVKKGIKEETDLRGKRPSMAQQRKQINEEKQRAIDGSTDNTVRLKKARKTSVEMQTNEQQHGRNMGTKL